MSQFSLSNTDQDLVEKLGSGFTLNTLGQQQAITIEIATGR